MSTERLRYPKLRPVEVHPFEQDGQKFILLSDPLKLSDKVVVLPYVLRFLLPICDGSYENAQAMSDGVTLAFGLRIDKDIIQQFIEALDAAFLLDNASFAEHYRRAVQEYRNAPFRSPYLAGHTYPDNAAELQVLLAQYLAAVSYERDISHLLSWKIRGLVSPHIDYARGGPAYAQVWHLLADAARDAELVIILGTDHHSNGQLLTLTPQNYATPYGILPTAVDVVDALAAALGEAQAFGGELNHLHEHSVELAAVWLHHMRGGEPCEVLPVLCGSFGSFIDGDADVAQDVTQDRMIKAFVDTLRPVMAGRRTLVVAAGDMAHVGPAFGGEPVDSEGKGRVLEMDDLLIDFMREGNAAGFMREVQRVEDRNNVCGVPPIYLALRLLEPVRGEVVAHTSCPADEAGTSIVTICGVVFE